MATFGEKGVLQVPSSPSDAIRVCDAEFMYLTECASGCMGGDAQGHHLCMRIFVDGAGYADEQGQHDDVGAYMSGGHEGIYKLVVL